MSDEKHYKMPAVRVGQDVWWYPHGDTDQEPHAAKVTRLGQDSVCLAVFAPDTYNLMVRDGVRHVTDPRPRENEDVVLSGTWDYPAEHRDGLAGLAERVARLERLYEKGAGRPAERPAEKEGGR